MNLLLYRVPKRRRSAIGSFSSVLLLMGCSASPPAPGPDKQFGSALQGAVTGAGTGAITGFQLSAATGPGAVLGAGLGAAIGSVQGAVQDSQEERSMHTVVATDKQRQKAIAHHMLQEHMERRLALHPGRDIYPADIFFSSDGADICGEAVPLLNEIAALSRKRHGWSRLAVTTYVVSSDPNATYAKHLAEHRALAIANQLIRSGIEPRRVEARALVVAKPVLRDPFDHPARFSQAVEISLLDY